MENSAAAAQLQTLPIDDEVRAFLESGPRMSIGGKPADARAGGLIDVFDPATGTVIAQVPAGQQEDVDDAVAAARAALTGEWARLRPADRERTILRLADILEANGSVNLVLRARVGRSWLGLLQKVEVTAYCREHQIEIANPKTGCRQCQAQASRLTGKA